MMGEEEVQRLYALTGYATFSEHQCVHHPGSSINPVLGAGVGGVNKSFIKQA